MTNELFKRKLMDKGYFIKYDSNNKQWIVKGNKAEYKVNQGNLQSLRFLLTT